MHRHPPTLEIAGHLIGLDRPAFIIAEIGVNHDGCVDTALRLVESARQAGADAVKLQLFKASRLLHANAGLASYQQAAGEADALAMLRKYELSDGDVNHLVDAIRQMGLVPLATPFSPEDVELIARLKLPAVKLASPDLVNPLLMIAAERLGVPLVLSTGAATGEETSRAVARLRRERTHFALLHCVSSYPTHDNQAELGRIQQLGHAYGCVAGLSDHTQNLSSGALAVACGGRIIEKHLTHDRAARGPDHAASADPAEFALYVRNVRAAEELIGVGHIAAARGVLACEHDVRVQSRQSLVARRAIYTGQRIRFDMLTCQRPGTGISAGNLDRVIGQVAMREIAAGSMLDWSDLSIAVAA